MLRFKSLKNQDVRILIPVSIKNDEILFSILLIHFKVNINSRLLKHLLYTVRIRFIITI